MLEKKILAGRKKSERKNKKEKEKRKEKKRNHLSKICDILVSVPFLKLPGDHFGHTLGIIWGSGIISGTIWGSFRARGSFRVGDHFGYCTGSMLRTLAKNYSQNA